MYQLHCRYTPYDISGYLFTSLEWIIDKMIVAYEDKKKTGEPTEPHFHIYMETKGDITDDTIRNHIRKALCIPKGGKGKNNKYYCIDWKWKDPSYICKYDDIRVNIGYSEPELLRMAVEGKQTYLKKEANTAPTTEDVVKPTTKSQRINYDKEIIADLLIWYSEQKHSNDEMSPPEIKEIIREACNVVRKYHRGINIFKVRDYVHTVMYEGGDYSDSVIKTIYKLI